MSEETKEGSKPEKLNPFSLENSPGITKRGPQGCNLLRVKTLGGAAPKSRIPLQTIGGCQMRWMARKEAEKKTKAS